MAILPPAYPDELDDRAFMEQLYLDFERLMFSKVKSFVSNPADQEDLIQECLINLMKKIETIRKMPRCVLSGYIVITIRNTAIDYLRRQARKAEEASLEKWAEESDFEPEDETLPLDDFMIQGELREQFAALWPRLPEEDHILLEGKYILGLTDAELAQTLGCKVSSVRMKLTRARRKALKLLQDGGELIK